MSDHEPTPGPSGNDLPDAWPDAEAPTLEEPTITSVLTAPPAGADGPSDEEPDENDEWAVRGPARGVRLGIPVAALLAVLLVAAGFWGGAALEKSRRGASRAGTGLVGRVRGAGGFFAGGGGGFSLSGGAAATSAGTTGTISVVNGNTLYVLSSTGALVKVTLAASTTITRTASTTATGLRPGDTVTIQGTTAANGDLAATSISSTAPGASSATGGFGAAAGAGGGSSTGGAATTTTAGT